MSNKQRVMALLEYLKENTNASHKVNAETIIQHLATQGFSVERKTIYNDIAQLSDMGYFISKEKDGYYFDNELFELAELKMLVDSVNSSTFLSKKKSRAIKDKLLSLTNVYDRKLVDESKYESNKTENEQILYNIDAIIRAIADRSAITFKYYDIDLDKKKNYRQHNYQIYPYSLIVNNNRYYLIGQSIKRDNLSNYRLDKMDQVKPIDEKFYDVPDIKDYMNKVFSMFSGEMCNITLKCSRMMFAEIEDKFGKDAIITEKNEDYFICNVNALISPPFYSWLFTFANEIEILTPQKVKDQFMERCSLVLETYK